MMAQSYPYSIEHIGENAYKCIEDEYYGDVEEGIISFECAAYKDKDPYVYFNIISYRKDIAQLSNNAKTITDDGFKYTESYPIEIHLDNDEKLFSSFSLYYDSRKEKYQNATTGVGVVGFYFSRMNSNKVSLSDFNNFKKCQYVAQQLRTHSITKIVINGVTVKFVDFKTKDTFDSMFNVLGEKIGEPEKFRYTASSSSSSPSSSSFSTTTSSSSTTASKTVTASNPTATGNMGYLNVTPSGDIVCRIDDLNIVGAKEKNVQVMLVFDYEDKEENVSVFKENTKPNYDDSVYESFRIIGSVDEIKTLRNRNSARYGVYLWVWLDNGDGSFKTLAEIKHGIVTIYKDGSGWALM